MKPKMAVSMVIIGNFATVKVKSEEKEYCVKVPKSMAWNALARLQRKIDKGRR